MTTAIAFLLITSVTALLLAAMNRHDGLPWLAATRTPPRSHQPDQFTQPGPLGQPGPRP